MNNPLEVLHLSLKGMESQLAQAATQLRRLRFNGDAPDMVASVTDACALSEISGLLGGAEAAIANARLTLTAHMREVDRRVAQDGRA